MPPLFKYDVICSICRKRVDQKTLVCEEHGVDHGIMSSTGYVSNQTVYLPDNDFDPRLTVVVYAICQLVANIQGFYLALTQEIKSGESIGTIYFNLTAIEWKPVLLFIHKTDGDYVIKNKHNGDFVEISIKRVPNQAGNAYTISIPRSNIYSTVFGDDDLRHFEPLWNYIRDALNNAKSKKEAFQTSHQPNKNIRQRIREIISQTDIFSAP